MIAKDRGPREMSVFLFSFPPSTIQPKNKLGARQSNTGLFHNTKDCLALLNFTALQFLINLLLTSGIELKQRKGHHIQASPSCFI